MAKRLVAADASPLIGLATAGAFDLLRSLFGQVTVTTTVHDEVLAGGELPGVRELTGAVEARRVTVARTRIDTLELADLDAGEASTLTLALEHPGPSLVLMDEAFGRVWAREHGLTVIGVAGVLLAAKEARLVQSIRPYFALLERSNFRLSNEIIRAVLAQAGE